MTVLMAVSVSALFAAMAFLARVEVRFMNAETDAMEDLQEPKEARQYFIDAYFHARAKNAAAARGRARSFLLLLLALASFVSAVTLLPLHLDDTGVNGRQVQAAYGGG